MKKWHICLCGMTGAGLILIGTLARVRRLDSTESSGRANETWADQLAPSQIVGDSSRSNAREAASYVALPETQSAPPTGEEELLELVAWMRTLDPEELSRLSNAGFGFENSELIEMLQGLKGPWVMETLGRLAVAEANPLVKAILVVGLFGTFSPERLEDKRALPLLDELMSQMGRASEDMHDVARDLASFAYLACGGGDEYARLLAGHLADSDNRHFLIQGYLFMGAVPGGEAMLKEVLTTHASPEGRMGALEGLRSAATHGHIAPEEITALGLAALETETNDRNRLLLYEMMISTGGDGALDAVEQSLRAGNVSEIDETVEMLALKMEPNRARALFEDLLRDHELAGDAKQSVYNAMGLLPGEEGSDFLLGLAKNADLEGGERLAGLRALWNRPVDERLAGELRSVFETAGDPGVRTEALRMLVHGEDEGRSVDLRQIATQDDDPEVRAEAVQLAAMQPSENNRAWLEERLLQDGSLDVKAAALGALVYQSHYTGDGEAVLGYLARARQFTNDESALAMIAEGERMVKEYDPRNLELGLAKEAEFWGTVAKYADGPAARSFERQARQLEQIVTTLRGSRDGRRSAH